MFNPIRDIQKLKRFLAKYCTKETSAPIINENAVDVAILILQKYLLTSVKADLLKPKSGSDDNPP